MSKHISFGFPRLLSEKGERRDFLPPIIATLRRLGASVTLEHDYGIGLGLTEQDYAQVAPGVHFDDRTTAFGQDMVLILRYPELEELQKMKPGACLISMTHYPTRPDRVAHLTALGLEVISLDSIKDDSGRRLIENLRAVAWNGLEAGFGLLQHTYPAPGFTSPLRPPIQVTLLGAGAVGSHVMQAATRYANTTLHHQLAAAGVPGVMVTVVDYDLTPHAHVMHPRLARTDMLVDATQRPDPSRPVIPNTWLAHLPPHAVIVDLSVDPYNCQAQSRSVKGVEGIPQGNLDQFTFAPDDPAYATIPPCVDTTHRRHVASCYSWPGVHPQACMEVYGRQLQPIVRTLCEKGGPRGINPSGRFFERAIARAQLSQWNLNLFKGD